MKLVKNPKSVSIAVAIFVFIGLMPCDAQPVPGAGLKFNGEIYVDCGNPPDNLFDFTGEGTIEAWVKITKTPPAPNSTIFYPILAKDEGPGEKNKWIFGVQNGKLVFHINNQSENDHSPFSQFVTVYSQSFDLRLNRYYHFALTKDKNDIVTFYVNGVEAGSSQLMRKTRVVAAPLLIGKAERGFQMTGGICEVTFWKKALTRDEINDWMFKKVTRAHPEFANLAACFSLSKSGVEIVPGLVSTKARLEHNSSPLLDLSFLKGWLIILIAAIIVTAILCYLLIRMQNKLRQEKIDMELFAAQMSHESNNGIGMMINILSSQLNEMGFGHLDDQLKQRLQTIVSLQSTEYILCGEKEIAFKKYVTDLVDKMNSAYSQGKQIVYSMDMPDQIKAKYAMKLAILIRELTLNSLKHAFSEKSTGEINISLTQAGKGFLRFEFCDNGKGIVEQQKSTLSVGTALINSVSSQLGGKPEIVSINGYKFVLMFRQ